MATVIETLAKRARPTLRRYGVRRASVFGSYARGQEEPESDLDLLVELPPGSSLLVLVGLEQDLSDEQTRALSNQGVNLPLQGSHLAASYGRFAFR